MSNQTAKRDLADLTDCLESLAKTLPKLTKAEKVDVGARIRAVLKSAKRIDDSIKDEIEAWRGQKEGVVKGELFQAILKYVSVNRLDQELLKEEQPQICEDYTKECEDRRITYQPR